MWLLIFLIIIFALALGGGGWGHSRGVYWGWSPAAVILAVIVVMYFTGHIGLH
jgi:hypothetical protein